jgi:hypothetical protein
MKKFLVHIFKYGLLIFLFLNIISWASLYFLRNASFYKPAFLTHKIKQKSFDYIVIGSSIGLTSLDTNQMDSITGKKGLNLSIDDTALSSNYLMLKHFFEQDKKTSICVLAISYRDLSEANPKLNNNDYRFLPFVSKDYVYDYYKNLEKGYFKPLTLSRYMPVFGVGYYNTELFYPSLIALVNPNKRNRFDEKGNYSYPEFKGVKKRKLRNVILNWKNPYFNKIEQLCIKNNTKLLVYQAPIYNTKIVNFNTGVNFINDSNVVNEEAFFYDEIHLNSKGTRISSAIFAQELIKNY